MASDTVIAMHRNYHSDFPGEGKRSKSNKIWPGVYYYILINRYTMGGYQNTH